MGNRKSLSDPVRIGQLDVPNRLYAAPMVCLHATERGNVTQRLLDIYQDKGKGGWGLVCVEASSIRYDGRLFTRMLGNYEDQQIAGLNELAEAIQDGGAKSCIQIMHGGRQASARFNGGVHPMAPSPINPWPPGSPPPREMTTQECTDIADNFAQAAGRAQEAGFDMVQLHAAHGFLLQQFMSPYTNQRKDKYGDRLELVREVIGKVRGVVGKDYPIGIRVSVDEFLGDQGITIDDFSLNVGPALEAAGVDWIDVSAGLFETLVHWIPPVYFNSAYLVHLAQKMKEHVKIPVSGIGKINSPDVARKVVEESGIDMVAFGRQVVADPQFAAKVLDGRDDEIKQCIACDLGCTSRLLQSVGIQCAINFDFGRDRHTRAIVGAKKPRRVLVIGGGIAGMEAARVLAIRGHKPVIYEKSSNLGGIANYAAMVPKLATRDLRNIVKYLKKEMKRLEVEIHLDNEVTTNTVAEINPDVVVMAVGSLPLESEIPGADGDHVFLYDQYYCGEATLGETVVVVGGNHGAETALSLAKRNRKVILVEETDTFAAPPYIYFGRMLVLQDSLKEAGVDILTQARVTEIKDNGVVVFNDGEEKTISCDTVILAIGRRSENGSEVVPANSGLTVHRIGDCVKPGSIMTAMTQATTLARKI